MCRTDRYHRILMAFFLLLVTIRPAFAAAQEPKAEQRAERTAANWDLSASIQLLPAAGLHGTAADAAITDYRFKLSRNQHVGDRLSFSTGGGYGFKRIDAPSSVALPHDLHAVSLELGSRYRFSSQAFASFTVVPGLNSDFDGGSGSRLRIPLLALGGYGFDNGFTLIGGLLYRIGYQAGNFIPALGFSYQPNSQWRFDAIMPRPAITYIASRQLRLFLAGDFASDEYDVNKSLVGASVIKYNDYKISGGVSYFPVEPVKLTAAAGYAFDRSLCFYDGNRPDLRLDSAPFFRFSLDLGW